MMWVNDNALEYYIPSEKDLNMRVVYVPDGFSLKYSMSNLIDASQRGRQQRVQKKRYIC
jgi:hypothetical protein